MTDQTPPADRSALRGRTETWTRDAS